MSYEQSAGGRVHSRYKRNYLFRSLGLELPTLLRFGSPAKEGPKPVYRTSLKAALSSSAGHVLPILAALTAVVINLKTMYLGRTLTGQIKSASVNIAMLQVAAKLVELLIISSLTRIVAHTIRKEMMVGNDVPLGVISGAFLFSSLNYFWSPELWGSLGSKISRSAKLRVFGMLLFSGLLAAFAGPSTAVLLVPKDQAWVAGSSDVYIRGSPDEVWSRRLESVSSGSEPFCSLPNATEYSSCPSGGYLSMLPFRTIPFQRHNVHAIRPNASSFAFGSSTIVIPSTSNRMPSISLRGNWRSYACETSMTGIHGAEAIYLSQILRDWHQIVLSIPYAPTTTTTSEYKYTPSLKGTTVSRAPVVRVACSDAQNISSVNREVEFPFLPNEACWSSTKRFEYKDLNQTSSNDLRTTWIQLPETFGSVSAGLLFEGPWVEGSSRVVLGCSIDARWANATLSTTGNLANPDSVGDVCEASKSKMGPWADWPRYSEFRPTNDSAWSNIQLLSSWLDILTPYVEVNDIPGKQPWHAKTLERLLYDALTTNGLLQSRLPQTEIWNSRDLGSLNRTVTLEWVLATVIADGLSREGSARVLNTTGAPGLWTILDYKKSKNFAKHLLNGEKTLDEPAVVPLVKKRASILISGYSYKASVFTDYLAISVLVLYILLAIYHMAELVIQRRVSDSWDTITELIALMHNSRPAPVALKHTCAGIQELATYAHTAIIRVLRPDRTASAMDIPRLEVIFHEQSQEPVAMIDLSSDDASSMNTRLLSAPAHSKTWAPGSRNSFESTSALGQDWRHYSQQVETSELRRRTNSEMTKVQADTLYGG